MTNINISVGELSNVSSKSEVVNEEIKVTFNGIINTLDDVSRIIQSRELTSNNKRLGETMGIITRNVNNSLLGIKQFLDSQLEEYSVSVNAALNSLNTLIQNLNNGFIDNDTLL